MTRANLKIGFVFDDSLDSNDGVSQQVKILGSYFSTQGHQVRYLVGQTKMKQWKGGKVYSLARNIKVSFNGNKLSVPLPASRKQITRILDDEKFDILHVQMPYSPFLAQRIIKKAYANTAIIGTFHVLPAGRLSTWGSRVLRMLYGSSLSRFDYIASVSKPAAVFAHQAFGINSLVVPNTIDTKQFIPKEKTRSSNSTRKIIFLNRLVKRKGCKQLIDAFALVLKSLPSTRLVIAGDGSQRPKLERLVKRLGISENVEFLGYIDESEKPKLLASADIACFPSLYGESFGVVLLEAMAAGADVVLGGDNPGYTSVLSEQPILLINPKDTVLFAARLERLLTEKAAIESLHVWQREYVKQYDAAKVGAKYLDIYESVIAKHERNGHN